MKVLIIDDSPEAVALVRVRLSRDGLDVVSADCGTDGILAVRRESPDLILLDVDMPDMTGFDVCRMLKAEPDLCMIPVVFLTASDTAEDKVKGLNIGAIDYITKPFDAFELQARVNAGLRTKYMQDLLTERANVDPLTGLANSRAMSNRLAEEWARVERHGRPLSFVMAEMDRFERITSIYGRSTGDRALQVASETIAAQCRQVDLSARCTGGEFGIIVPDEIAKNAAKLAERCQERISKMHLKVNGEEIWATVSFGIADTEGKTSLKDLIESARQALLMAQRTGGNRVVIESTEDCESDGSPKPHVEYLS
ncbi:MAG: diguanylate cyclase [Phycisphaerae bacterium]|jgi:diguanylate cyclase (GGDEF)-like protein|nr:diguanylate cyclase [Phycisphaerae bacterium]